MDVVRDHGRQAELLGQAAVSATSQSSSGRRWCWSSRTKPAAARCRLAAARLRPGRGRRRLLRTASRSPRRPGAPLAIADPEPPGDLAVATARQGDQPFDVLGEEGLGEAGHALRPGQVGPADQAAQAPIAGRRRGRAGRGAARATRRRSPGRSSLTGSRRPGRRVRSGRGRAGRPSLGGAPRSAAGRLRRRLLGRWPPGPRPRLARRIGRRPGRRCGPGSGANARGARSPPR